MKKPMRFKLALELHFFAGDLVEATIEDRTDAAIVVTFDHCASNETLAARTVYGHADPRPASTVSIPLDGRTETEAVRLHLERTLGVKVEVAS